jgi:hypothetical protein
MIDLSGVKHHPVISEITEVLCNKTQNTDRGFFQIEVAFFISKMAACQRAVILTKDRGQIPVNTYALALATSGYGKGYSVGVMEDEFLAGFRTRFMEETMPVITEQNLIARSNDRALRSGKEPDEELDKLTTQLKALGTYPFTFDSGTTPAVKQLRDQLLLRGCGSINLQIDEIGSNLVGQVELLTAYLELYDQGKIKMKLTKNTSENTRVEDIDGKTPTNMLLFGTPSKLFDGGQVEDQFYSFLDTGYARRCLFGIGVADKRAFHSMDPAEIYYRQTQPQNNMAIVKWSTLFHKLGGPDNYGWRMEVADQTAIRLLEYKINCEREAELLAEHEEIRKAELSHRYFKALKLAGALAFIDESSEVTLEDHLLPAILLVEESGQSFQSILTREKAYVKLAKYIADMGTDLTHADLNEALPFYKTSAAFRNEQMSLAMAWGYRHNIIIKKSYNDNIELFRGEKLKETDLDHPIITYSDSFAYNYDPVEGVAFRDLEQVLTYPNLHWANHAFTNRHRTEENAIAGFNFVTIDVDGGTRLETVHEMLKDYTFITYTTKRHTDDVHRFRLLLPIKYVLKLDSEEYRDFMNALMTWLPFASDEASNQRSKKWMTHPGQFHYNEGSQLVDPLPFIPKTMKSEQYQKELTKLESLDNLERWFAGKISSGNRNNQMLKYAMVLVDNGWDYPDVHAQVHSFNKKLANPLDADEIDGSIMITVGKKIAAR